MSTLLLLILFAFVAFAIWIGFRAYRATQRKSGPVPPAQTVDESSAQTVEEPSEQVVKEPTEPGRPESGAGPKPTESDVRPNPRPESDTGPKPSSPPAPNVQPKSKTAEQNRSNNQSRDGA